MNPGGRAGSNPVRAEHGWPPAMIAGASQTGVLGVRGLTRRGVRASCFDCEPDNPGFHSVYGPAWLCPDPDTDPVGWVEFMVERGAAAGARTALIPSSDRFVSAIARHSEALAAHFILSPGIETQSLLVDKRTQYELAASHGMPMPRTRFVTDAGAVAEFAREAVFPCLIKPLTHREWLRFPPGHALHGRKVAIADSQGALIEQYRLVSALNPNAIVQEIIEGPDTAKRVYLSCYDVRGQRVANAMFRELRCDPLGFGPASVSEPVTDPETDEICDRFLRSLGYVGVCEIEAKRDARDGRVKLIEVNPRLSGGGDAAPYAGVDLPWLHYLELIGAPVAPVAPAARDFRHVVLRADARAIIAYRRAGRLSWRDLLRSYRPPLAFFDVDVRDWRYSAITLYLAGRSLAAGIFSALGVLGPSS